MLERADPGKDMAAALLALMDGFRISQAIAVAAELGIADRLVNGPVACDTLASAVCADPDTLYRLLRALASVGVFTECRPHTFALTLLAEPLRSDHPQSMRAIARYNRQDWYWQPWAHLLDAVRTGQAAFDRVHGIPLFTYLATHFDAAAVFNAAMTGGTHRKADLVGAYDFAPLRLVVDIGGGQGGVLAAILKSHPHLRGILFDLPSVVAGAAPGLEAAGALDRCKIVGGDFFVSVPEGGDAYVLSQVLHDWDDEQATAILQSCHRAD